MTLQELLGEPGWDAPFFKRLANNDTGAAAGHQSGPYIPVGLRQYFPGLNLPPPGLSTVDRPISCDLFDGSRFLARVVARYQFQTWRRKRSPEARVTSNLTPLTALASGGDVLVIQRREADLERFRFFLIRKDSPEATMLNAQVRGRPWGSLGEKAPMSSADYESARSQQAKRELQPFALFEPDPQVVSATTSRIARSAAFRERVLAAYPRQCSVCGNVLQVPEGPLDLQAAHIVPRALGGSDDFRNGLPLCRRHHWAFDEFLFGVDSNHRIVVPSPVGALTENEGLLGLVGTPIARAPPAPAPEALAWHLDRVRARWD